MASDKVIQTRFEWVDALKFLGIFAIYLGHCGTSAGKLYQFVFLYHVPLFFFVSGFFYKKDKELSIYRYIVKKFKSIMIPYIIFSIVAIIIFTISQSSPTSDIVKRLYNSILGVRNTLVAGSLWFLPCMFITSTMYHIINACIKNKYFKFITIISFLIITQKVLPHNPLINPKWFMNIDSAMYYLSYYYFGDILFEIMCSFSFKALKPIKKIIMIAISLLAILIAYIAYIGKINHISSVILREFTFISSDIIEIFLPVFIAMVIIFLNILIANCIKDVLVFREIGKNTLIYCGVENITKELLSTFLTMFGIPLHLYNPLACILYTFFCLMIVYMAEKCLNYKKS